MVLDIRTLLFLTIFYSLFIGVILLLFKVKYDRTDGYLKIGVGILTFGLGYLLFSLNGMLPDVLTIVFANWFIIAGMMIISYGLSELYNVKNKWIRIDIVLMAILFLGYVYYTLINVNVNYRIIFVSVFELIYFLRISKIVINKKNNTVPDYINASYFIMLSIFVLIRIIFTLQENQIASFLESGFVHAISIIIYQIMPFVLTISCFWKNNILAEEKLLRMATTDPLTGLTNRRRYMDILHNEKERENRYGNAFGLLMIDIDHFKMVNDTYGHTVGDIVLKDVSRKMEANIRECDTIARIGGEEFSALVTNTSQNELLDLAERLRVSVEQLYIKANNKVVNVTISVGVTLSKNDKTVSSMLIKSDEALYEAKSDGRNRVIYKG
ncbi:MAG: GGDEF domain-containing protein [Clostridiales bacterium]|nr:GGDEF domain-containing protein [Clostridiales bacterium]